MYSGQTNNRIKYDEGDTTRSVTCIEAESQILQNYGLKPPGVYSTRASGTIQDRASV